MCGIAAAFGAGPEASVALLADMISRHLSHRGPDGVGVAQHGRSVVAHSRLAIVNVGGGQQPMHSEDGGALLVCNGEIYNHRALRDQLAPHHQLKTNSDSEVVVHLFEDGGAEVVRKLDGMFAFFVTDGERFVAARDPFGIKPLYVGEDRRGGLWFASELKALVGRCATMIAVPPGAYLTESQRVTRWFRPAWMTRTGTATATAQELVAALEPAVVKRLMSDVPVGVLLSGGLDSSLVAALAAKHLPRIATFAVGVEGAPDLAAARVVAEHIGATHHECTFGVPDVSRHLDEIIYHLESYDAALIRSAMPCYFVSGLAAQRVKVVLTGEGADELFAGYGYMQRMRDPTALHHECTRLLLGLHAMNLQRVDRMTMAHGLEGRVPFLDVDFVDFAMGLDPALKVRAPRGLEKALLRAAACHLLPERIAARPKLEFSEGSATDVSARAVRRGARQRLGFFARSGALSDGHAEEQGRALVSLGLRRALSGRSGARDGLALAGAASRALDFLKREEHMAHSEPQGHVSDVSGTWTYSETVARGLYEKDHGGLFGKHDNVRTYWEDELTRIALRPYVRERAVSCAASGRRLRVVDLGCGSGQGYELLTRIRQRDLSLEDAQRYVLTPEQFELYLGLDLSDVMVEQGRHNYRKVPHVAFRRADLREGLGPVARERPFDIYFSSYGSLSHLGTNELRTCLRGIARHAAPGALIVMDLIGRFSPEWPGYWHLADEAEKVQPYSMSYLFADEERRTGNVQKFPLRFWSGDEVRVVCDEVSADTGVDLDVVEILDRSIFVGRHVDTREYGTSLPPLRRLVNHLYEHNVRTHLEQLLVDYQATSGPERLNAHFSRLSLCWNTVIQFAQARLSGTRIDLAEMPGWRDFPAALQMALVTMDRIVNSVAWIDVGDVRANIIEPQLAYVLRRMQSRLQDGRGCGHGLLALVRVSGSPNDSPPNAPS